MEDLVKTITSILVIFIIFDVLVSWIAAYRQTERKNGIAPKNEIDVFLDEHYPDEYIDSIFANKKDV